MTLIFKIKKDFKTLDNLTDYLKSKTQYKVTKTFDCWREVALTKEYCVLVKKSALYGVKIKFVNDFEIAVKPVVPNNYLRGFTIGRGFLPPFVRMFLQGGQKRILDEVTNSIKEIYN